MQDKSPRVACCAGECSVRWVWLWTAAPPAVMAGRVSEACHLPRELLVPDPGNQLPKAKGCLKEKGEAPQWSPGKKSSPDVQTRHPSPLQDRGGCRWQPFSLRALQLGFWLFSPVPPSSSPSSLHQAGAAGSLPSWRHLGLQPSSLLHWTSGCCGALAPVSGGTLGKWAGGLLFTWLWLFLPLCCSWELR